MIATLRQGETKQNINSVLNELLTNLKPKGVQVKKYVGKIKLQKDALTIQRELRDEW